MELTQKELKRVLDYNSKTGIFTWKVSKQGMKKNKIAGCKTPTRGVSISINYKQYKAHRLAWLYIKGFWPKDDIRHINRDKNDNRFINLQNVSRLYNLQNQKMDCRNSSGIIGVYWVEKFKNWKVQIQKDYETIYLGTYKNKDDAVKTRWAAEKYHSIPIWNTTSTAYKYLKERNLI